MKNNKNEQVQLAAKLLEKNAVKLNPARTFVWASGIKSPIYCDNRKLLSYSDVRKIVAKAFASKIKEKYSDVEIIAGVATGAIAWGILVAEILEKPFIYIRSQQKKHGLGNRIEGEIGNCRKVVVIEDLISTGGSSLSAVKALRESDIEVLGMMALFSYGLPVAKRNFETENCELTTLTNFEVLLQEAKNKGYITLAESMDILDWKEQV